MSERELYAVSGALLFPQPVPDSASDVHGLFAAWSTREAIYSALRSYQHDRFLRLDAHFERCTRCLERAGWDTDFDAAGLRQAIHRAVSSRQGDVRLRFDIFEHPIDFGDVTSRVLLGIEPCPAVAPELLREGVNLGLAPVGFGRPQPLIKFVEWVSRRRACWQHGSTCYEYLLLDEHHRILEGTSSNFYTVRDSTLITAGDGVLEGITRQIVLELAERRGLALELRRVPVRELERCDEAFITSSTRELVGVSRIDELVLGSGKPGPVTTALSADYRSYAETTARPAVHGETPAEK